MEGIDPVITKQARGYMKESTSADLSARQEKYRTLFDTMCKERGVSNPFELDDAELKKFFSEISERWAQE